tara:strand:- start:454 stop:834 length:381 start_codon:yes stop_codon:yes gene_type:complete
MQKLSIKEMHVIQNALRFTKKHSAVENNLFLKLNKFFEDEIEERHKYLQGPIHSFIADYNALLEGLNDELEGIGVEPHKLIENINQVKADVLACDDYLKESYKELFSSNKLDINYAKTEVWASKNR